MIIGLSQIFLQILDDFYFYEEAERFLSNNFKIYRVISS